MSLTSTPDELMTRSWTTAPWRTRGSKIAAGCWDVYVDFGQLSMSWIPRFTFRGPESLHDHFWSFENAPVAQLPAEFLKWCVVDFWHDCIPLQTELKIRNDKADSLHPNMHALMHAFVPLYALDSMPWFLGWTLHIAHIQTSNWDVIIFRVQWDNICVYRCL